MERRACPIHKLRVLTYNIQVGISYTSYRHYVTRSWKHVLPFHGRQENLDSIARFISGFDIVGLQEVDAGSLRSSYINQARYLAQMANFSNWYVHTNRNLGKIAQHSLGLLTDLHAGSVVECKLPGRIPGRGALFALFGEGKSELVVGIIHLSLGRKARSRQFDFLSSLVDAHEHVLLMGDFNCRIDQPEFQHFLDRTHLCSPEKEFHTYPSWRPVRGLDHILVTPDLTVDRTHVYNTGYSDHLPIALEISLPASMQLSKDQRNPLMMPIKKNPVIMVN
jgi:endonuclease/exonuclease/phosphatase family metal-dependent hydrolase